MVTNESGTFPEFDRFKTLLDDKPKVKPPEGFEHSTDWDESEADWRLGNYIPNSYVENGIRHAVVWDESETRRYKLINGLLLEEGLF
jgi:hypothetical protein